ncbi:MAG TPA: formylglycine-generating enzyme family protein [Polyangiaceae bacterium]|jgi:formylglycine-generating enzyme required for sulfatase activity
MIRRGWLVLVAACHGAPAASIDASPVTTAAPDASDVKDASLEAATAPAGMLAVPAGTFTMGADQGGEEDERPAHRVTLAGFFLDRTPVTNEAYEACVKAGACAALYARDPKYTPPLHPVNTATWDEAKAYCAWRGARLPREAEYERAMRGDDGRTYAWGSEWPTPERATFGRPLKTGATDDVGTHPMGRGPYGHDDLAGDVWEWMEDEYDPYAYRRATADRGVPGTCAEIMQTQDELRSKGLEGFTGSNPIPRMCEHVLRGGAFNYDANGLRATNRVHHPGYFRLVMAGFRCARDQED